MNQQHLYLGSKSKSRRMLLDLARISYSVVPQDADETVCDRTLSLDKLVLAIALYKMDHVLLPSGYQNQICYVLTADTMVEDAQGRICGKPVDYADAVSMIKSARAGSKVSTAFCIDKKEWQNNEWNIIEHVTQVVETRYKIDIPDEWIDTYFANSPGMECAGACSIEDYGAQFLQYVNGSYSTIIGLPLFEVREALTKLGFFK